MVLMEIRQRGAVGSTFTGCARKAGGYLDLDARIWFFTDYYSMSPGMVSQTPGKGAKYMVAFTDKDGVPLSGARTINCIFRRIFPLTTSGR